jgi:hypothetical protein
MYFIVDNKVLIVTRVLLDSGKSGLLRSTRLLTYLAFSNVCKRNENCSTMITVAKGLIEVEYLSDEVGTTNIIEIS